MDFELDKSAIICLKKIIRMTMTWLVMFHRLELSHSSFHSFVSSVNYRRVTCFVITEMLRGFCDSYRGSVIQRTRARLTENFGC